MAVSLMDHNDIIMTVEDSQVGVKPKNINLT